MTGPVSGPVSGPDGGPVSGPGRQRGPERSATRPRVVALGGGHGLFAMLSALRRIDVDITAVVTVADDGGSSGRLRRDAPGVLPPGDLRMALAALAGSEPDDRLWGTTFQHRFSGNGALAGHPVGNIVLVGLAEVLGDPVAALDAAGRLLGARGRVLPLARRPLDLVAEVAGLDEDPSAVRQIRGQVAIAATPGQVRSVTLEPADAVACIEAIEAIECADLITLGPGSWFTSVLPHLMVADLAAAIHRTAAHRAVVLNLAPQPGETEGFSPEQHLHVLSEHAPGLRIDTVLADVHAVPLPQRLHTAARRMGARVQLARVADHAGPRHEPGALADALQVIVERAMAERAVAERATAEPALGKQAVGEPAAADSAVRERKVGKPAAAGRAMAERAVAERATAEPAVGKPAVAGPAVADSAVGERKVAHRSAPAAASEAGGTAPRLPVQGRGRSPMYRDRASDRRGEPGEATGDTRPRVATNGRGPA
jgi:uncharacterized cofD-like protein